MGQSLRQQDELKTLKEACTHSDSYRYWYNDDHLFNVYRHCFHESEEHSRPFLLEDYYDMSSGRYARTPEDAANKDAHQKRFNLGKYADLPHTKADLEYMRDKKIKLLWKPEFESLSPQEIAKKFYYWGAKDAKNYT